MCIDDGAAASADGFYLLTLKGSEQDGLTGIKGSMVRKVVVDKTARRWRRARRDQAGGGAVGAAPLICGRLAGVTPNARCYGRPVYNDRPTILRRFEVAASWRRGRFPARELMIGQTVSHYRILEKLGGGGMGVVYKAEDTRLGRFVALKFLPDERTAGERRARAVPARGRSRLGAQPPNICTIHDIGEHEGARVHRHGVARGRDAEAPDRRPAAAISKRCCRSASRSPMRSTPRTRSGIVHRDIKPANIFVTERGQAKMLDFGLAKVARQAERGIAGRRRRRDADRRASTSTSPGIGARHGGLHVAGAGARQRARRAHRSVLVRRRALRDGDGRRCRSTARRPA